MIGVKIRGVILSFGEEMVAVRQCTAIRYGSCVSLLYTEVGELFWNSGEGRLG